MGANISIEAKLNGRLEESCVILTSVHRKVDGLLASATLFGPMIKLDSLVRFRNKLSNLLQLFNLEKMQLAEANGTEYSNVDEMLTKAFSIVQSCKLLLIEHAAFEHSYKFREIELLIKDLLEFLTNEQGTTHRQKPISLDELASEYAYALDILDQYDHQQLEIKDVTDNNIFFLHYTSAKLAIDELKLKFGGSFLFGNEKDRSFKGSIRAIYQTFDGLELYPSVEEKAANLLYFIVKNHSFSDGNKRIAAFIFVWFLDQNRLLYKADGGKRIADNALVAITLLIAESKSEEKAMMVKVIVNLINLKN